MNYNSQLTGLFVVFAIFAWSICFFCVLHGQRISFTDNNVVIVDTTKNELHGFNFGE